MAVFPGEQVEVPVGWRRPHRSLAGPVAACVEAGKAKLLPDGAIILDDVTSGTAPVVLRPASEARQSASASTARSITDRAHSHIGADRPSRSIRPRRSGHPSGSGQQQAREHAREALTQAVQLIGALRWRGGSGPVPEAGWAVDELTSQGHPNDFVRWIRRRGPEPGRRSTMVCHEALLFAAYRAGLVDRAWLRSIYIDASDAAAEAYHAYRRYDPASQTYVVPRRNDGYGRLIPESYLQYYAMLMNRLHSGHLTSYSIDESTRVGQQDISSGDIVFFDGVAGHVALAVGRRDLQGRQQAISLWVWPDKRQAGSESYGYMQLTTVEELMEAGEFSIVEFAAPAWAQYATVQGPGGHALEGSGSVARSIIDPADPQVGMLQHTVGHIPVGSASERVVAAARQLIGGLRWRGGTGADASSGWRVDEATGDGFPNDMALWLHGKGPEPDERSTMNCWDAILFSAYRAGVIDRAWIDHLYTRAARVTAENARQYFDPSTNDYDIPFEPDRYKIGEESTQTVFYDAVMEGMVSGPLQRYTVDPRTGAHPVIPLGHIVFFNGAGGHVALSLGTRDGQGRQEVMSHWNSPRRLLDEAGAGFMQVTSVEELTAALGKSVIEFAAPAWAQHAVQRSGVSASAVFGSVAGSVIDPAAPHIGRRLPAGTLASESPTTQVRALTPMTPAHRAAWVKERTRPRPDVIAATGLTVAGLEAKVAAAAAEADDQLARTTSRFPWGALSHGLQEVCLAQMRALVKELFPLGLGSQAPLDDTVLPTDPIIRRWLERPQDWTWVTDWQALIDQVDGLGVNGAAFVVQGRPGAIGHAYALVNTTEGIHTADPQAGGVLPTSLAGLGPPFEVRALLIKPNGQAIQPPGGRAQQARPHVDIDPDGTEWASSKRSALDLNGKVKPKKQRSCVEITSFPLTADGPAWVQGAPRPPARSPAQ